MPVSTAVAKHAAVARTWLAAARKTSREQDRRDAFMKFEAAMRAAGQVLAAVLANENDPTSGPCEQSDLRNRVELT
jgi:predicted alpha/beta hydrolase family esterase